MAETTTTVKRGRIFYGGKVAAAGFISMTVFGHSRRRCSLVPGRLAGRTGTSHSRGIRSLHQGPEDVTLSRGSGSVTRRSRSQNAPRRAKHADGTGRLCPSIFRVDTRDD
ncbi:MAG: hypothetical protein Q7O66_16035 [Dehalococcoidia bacterium]|nr:hypothetical protein [Dehalococcoidia bacterium]